VYGNSFESCLVAVANPNEQALKRWAENNGIDAQDFPALCTNPKAREYILGELTKFAKEKKVIVISLNILFFVLVCKIGYR
jgi:long-chain acyl-CoA synthetase